jgi:hypothetical protein
MDTVLSRHHVPFGTMFQLAECFIPHNVTGDTFQRKQCFSWQNVSIGKLFQLECFRTPIVSVGTMFYLEEYCSRNSVSVSAMFQLAECLSWQG